MKENKCINCGHDLFSKDGSVYHDKGDNSDYPYSLIVCFCGCGNPESINKAWGK